MANSTDVGFRILTGLVRLAAGPFVRSLYGTCRITVRRPAIEREWFRRRPAIAALWHQTMIAAGYHFRGERVAVMASRSKDGELASALLLGLGLKPVRGSSSRGGREALREMIDAANAGYTPAFVADGPRGPAHEAKIGAVLAARATGLPLIGVAIHCDDAWHLRNWDRTAIPKPFSRIRVTCTDPIPVPADAGMEECEAIRTRLEEEMVAREAELRRQA